MRFSVAAVFSTLTALAAAYTQPDYSKPPTGNAITAPALSEQVPLGYPFTIQWDPTLGDRVSLVLLRGPSSNVQPIQTIVEDIPNDGSYTWTPSMSLTPDTTHYGLLIVVEGTGAYQWSPQFGLSTPGSLKPAEATTSVSGTIKIIDEQSTTICPEESSTATPTPTSTPAESTVTVIDDVTTTICPEEQSSSAAAAATSTPVSVPATPSATPSATPTPSTVVSVIEETTTYCPESSTAAPTVSTRMPLPMSSAIHRPSTMRSSPVSSVAPSSSTVSAMPTSSPVYNGAGRNAISMGAVAAGVFAVLAF